MTSQGETIVSMRDISVEFKIGGRQRLVAVDHVNLDLHKGETLGLIGESGSGKSTLARALVGLAPIASGTATWRGQDIAGLDKKTRRKFIEDIQMVFQDPHSALDPRRTILQSVREPLDVMNRGKKKDRAQRAQEMLEKVGLTDHHAARYPHQLSGGQKQRANIARALITDPAILICDESVAALDVALQAEILNLLQDLKEDLDLTIMFISHDLGVVGHIADRISVMYLGQVVEESTADNVMNRPLQPYSEALLSAQPAVDALSHSSKRRIVLVGDIPSPVSPPPGCRFNTRCPHALPKCSQTKPELQTWAPDHQAACLRVDELYPARILGESPRGVAS